MNRITYLAAPPLVAIVAFIAIQSSADGCAAVGRGGGPSIRIAQESAIIIWDPVKKIEHFIRSAAFDTKSPDFGFLVPTQPTLKEVDAHIFAAVDVWIRPRVVTQSRVKFDLLINGLACTKDEKKGLSPQGSVRVLAQQKVGGFQAVVLEADATEPLADWLKEHGYSSDPELQSWLAPYVAAKWKITAFKILQDPKTGRGASTEPVRMSFETDRPFFPYREPEQKKDDNADHSPRLLRVFFVSNARMDGQLGTSKWHARVPWSDSLTDKQREQLIEETGVPAADVPSTAWMTTFDDSASPRPGKEEVYFDPAQDQSPVRPPDRIVYHDMLWIPLDVAVFLGGSLVAVIAGIVLGRRMTRRTQA